jgi:hypothetical protein
MRWDPDVNTSLPNGRTPVDTFRVVSRLIPLDVTDPSAAQTFEANLTAAINVTNNHDVHTHTCAKGGRVGDDTDCRMNFPLALIHATCRLIDEMFAVRRTCGTVVTYVRGLMAAYPANHLIRLSCESSIWVRSILLWRDRVATQSASKQVNRLCFKTT